MSTLTKSVDRKKTTQRLKDKEKKEVGRWQGKMMKNKNLIFLQLGTKMATREGARERELGNVKKRVREQLTKRENATKKFGFIILGLIKNSSFQKFNV